MNKIFLCQIDEIDEGEALRVECGVNGIEALAVFNLAGEFFAMNDQYNTCYLVRLQGAVIHSSIKSGRAAALSNICSHNNSDF